jgi:uncharacterized protein
MQMQIFFSSDPFAARRPTFFANTLFLIAVMVLYPIAGALLFSFVGGGSEAAFSLSHIDSSMLSSIRLIQAVGQILVLAFPVLLLAGWHTGRNHLFSRDRFAFLGIHRSVDFSAVAFAVAGIFLLQPLLYTITLFQDHYLWPLLGTAGQEVVHQRDLMESFIKELALVRSVPEFFAVAFVLAFTPAICEELLFRGYIQQNYTRSLSSGSAVLLTGVIFALFHLSAANLLPLALLGWYIGYIYAITGNLAISFFVHFVNNLAALLFLLFSGLPGFARTFDSEHVLLSPWWWVVVAGSLLLFMMVLWRLLTVPSREEVLPCSDSHEG